MDGWGLGDYGGRRGCFRGRGLSGIGDITRDHGDETDDASTASVDTTGFADAAMREEYEDVVDECLLACVALEPRGKRA